MLVESAKIKMRDCGPGFHCHTRVGRCSGSRGLIIPQRSVMLLWSVCSNNIIQNYLMSLRCFREGMACLNCVGKGPLFLNELDFAL